jgi:hypothetical protein
MSSPLNYQTPRRRKRVWPGLAGFAIPLAAGIIVLLFVIALLATAIT